MRKTDSHSSEVQLSELQACAQRVPSQMYWVLDGLSRSRFDDIQATRAPVASHFLNGSHGIRCQTVQVGLDIISIQLAQQSTVSKERTKFRCVDDIEKRGQHRSLGKA